MSSEIPKDEKGAYNVTKFHLEIRKSSDGSIEGTDSFEGTEAQALFDAKHWLNECLTLDAYQKEILVIVVDTDECIYHGTFDLVPHIDIALEQSVSTQTEGATRMTTTAN